MNSSKKEITKSSKAKLIQRLRSKRNSNQLSFPHVTPTNYKYKINSLKKNNANLAIALQGARCQLAAKQNLLDEAYEYLNKMNFVQTKVLSMHSDLMSFVKNFEELVLLLKVDESKSLNMAVPARSSRGQEVNKPESIDEVTEQHSAFVDVEAIEKDNEGLKSSENQISDSEASKMEHIVTDSATLENKFSITPKLDVSVESEVLIAPSSLKKNLNPFKNSSDLPPSKIPRIHGNSTKAELRGNSSNTFKNKKVKTKTNVKKDIKISDSGSITVKENHKNVPEPNPSLILGWKESTVEEPIVVLSNESCRTISHRKTFVVKTTVAPEIMPSDRRKTFVKNSHTINKTCAALEIKSCSVTDSEFDNLQNVSSGKEIVPDVASELLKPLPIENVGCLTICENMNNSKISYNDLQEDITLLMTKSKDSAVGEIQLKEKACEVNINQNPVTEHARIFGSTDTTARVLDVKVEESNVKSKDEQAGSAVLRCELISDLDPSFASVESNVAKVQQQNMKSNIVMFNTAVKNSVDNSENSRNSTKENASFKISADSIDETMETYHEITSPKKIKKKISPGFVTNKRRPRKKDSGSVSNKEEPCVLPPEILEISRHASKNSSRNKSSRKQKILKDCLTSKKAASKCDKTIDANTKICHENSLVTISNNVVVIKEVEKDLQDNCSNKFFESLASNSYALAEALAIDKSKTNQLSESVKQNSEVRRNADIDVLVSNKNKKSNVAKKLDKSICLDVKAKSNRKKPRSKVKKPSCKHSAKGNKYLLSPEAKSEVTHSNKTMKRRSEASDSPNIETFITNKNKKISLKENVNENQCLDLKTNKKKPKVTAKKSPSKKNTFLVQAEIHPIPSSLEIQENDFCNNILNKENYEAERFRASVVLNDIFHSNNSMLSVHEKDRLSHAGQSYSLKTVLSDKLCNIPLPSNNHGSGCKTEQEIITTSSEINMRSSRRQRKSVNYKEPLLTKKMRRN